MKKPRRNEGHEEKMNSSPSFPSHLRGSELIRFRARLVRWFKKYGRDLPWRRTRDPYAVLVSEVMLQQTQVATVIPYFTRWMEKFPGIAALAGADEADALHA